MKLQSYYIGDKWNLGVSIKEQLYSLSSLFKDLYQIENFNINVLLDDVQQYIIIIKENIGNNIIFNYPVDSTNINISAPVKSTAKIICVGLNYQKHAIESGMTIPDEPILFSKFGNSIIGSEDSILIPKYTEKLDYEAELAIIIGKKAKDVAKTEALDYVLGYCNSNDISARDLQFKTSQWLLGKSCDGFLPIGPYLVTTDEILNPNCLEIKTFVNNEIRQESNTQDMIFKCDEIISYVSRYITLLPGDIIITGTPEGVVQGSNQDKGFLKDGDIVSVTIEGLGTLTNSFYK